MCSVLEDVFTGRELKIKKAVHMQGDQLTGCIQLADQYQLPLVSEESALLVVMLSRSVSGCGIVGKQEGDSFGGL